MRWVWTAAALLALACVIGACSKSGNEVVESAVEGAQQTPDLGKDPLALLPAAPLGVVVVDAQALFASEFGPDLLALVEGFLPLPPEAGFEPSRDLQTIYVGTYSMQGADVVAVLKAKLDPAAIDRVVDARRPTPLGVPLSRSQYAGRAVISAGDASFVVLSDDTALCGNTTALRRALDRIEEGRVRRDLQPWLESLVQTPGAPVVVGFDLAGHPVSDAVRQELRFLQGMQAVRVLGNFEPPGLNLAGSMSYGSDEEAAAGAMELRARASDLDRYAAFLALLGIGNPLVKFEVEASGKEARFVAGLSGPVLRELLVRARQWLPARRPPSVPAEPTPAPSSGAGS